MPATSLNVTFVDPVSIRRARERPNEPSAFIWPPAARRDSHTNRTTSRITGPKPRIRFNRKPRPWLIGSASTVTSCSSSCADSSSLSANVGISVSKFLAGSASESVEGLNSFLNSPLTVSPVLEIFVTFPASIWPTKSGWYGIVTDRSRPGAKIATLR